LALSMDPADTAFVSGCGFILCELELTLPKIWLEFRQSKPKTNKL
jgi:hypothetical protein